MTPPQTGAVLRQLSTAAGKAKTKVLVVGSGVIGVSTAYKLAKLNYDVTVVDRRSRPGAECSYGNASMFNISYARPKQVSVSDILSGLKPDKQGPLFIRPPVDAAFLKWGIEFLRNSSNDPVVTTGKMAALGMEHVNQMRELIAEQKSWQPSPLLERGLLHFFRTPQGFEAAVKDAEYKLGDIQYQYDVLHGDKVIEREPALRHLAGKIAGGIQFNQDITSDCFQYCQRMLEVCKTHGVKFLMNTSVTEIVLATSSGGAKVAKGVRTSTGEVVEADEVVVAAGAFSTPLAAKAGVNVPIYPLQGHSITFVAAPGSPRPSQSFGDGEAGVFYAPLDGGRVRVAAFGDFVGYRIGPKGVDNARLKTLMKNTDVILPGALTPAHWVSAGRTDRSAEVCEPDADSINAWTGLRPLSADNVPIIGRCKGISNLYMNAGHGVIGWTGALGSAEVLACAMENREVKFRGLAGMRLPTACNPTVADYSPARFN